MSVNRKYLPMYFLEEDDKDLSVEIDQRELLFTLRDLNSIISGKGGTFYVNVSWKKKCVVKKLVGQNTPLLVNFFAPAFIFAMFSRQNVLRNSTLVSLFFSFDYVLFAVDTTSLQVSKASPRSKLGLFFFF